MRPFFVVVPTPNAADIVQMTFTHDHELVQTFKLKSLDESLDVRPQIGCKRTLNRILRVTLFWRDLFPFPNGDLSNGNPVSECRQRVVLALAC